MVIVPIIAQIIEHEGLFYGINEQEETIFVTEHQEIANMYLVIPQILQQQTDTINTLAEQLKSITEEYNSMLMGIIQSGSNLIH